MSRVSDLEKKVDALERNVGMIAKGAGIDNYLMISDFSSIMKYKDGIECGCTPVKNDKVAFNIRETKIALVINKTPIYEYDGKAIYDLHIPTISFMCKTYLGGVMRSMTVSDIKKFFKDNKSILNEFNIVQDINHMSDIYIIP